ncbi:MAG: CoA transferase [Desertimonas sp.]
MGSDTAGVGPLGTVRVLAVGDSLAVAHAARTLADLGADVVVVEPPSGHALRHRPPLLADGTGAAAAGLLGGLRSAIVEPGDPDRRGEALLDGADVILHDDDQRLLDVDGGGATRPGLIAVHLSAFGRHGPFADDPDGDLMVWAASGMLTLVATDPARGPLEPVRLRGELTSVLAAGHAVVAALGALHARLADGFGQTVEVTALESMVAAMATAPATVSYTGIVPVAGGVRGVIPWGIYRCRGGDVLVQCTEDAQWATLVDLLGSPEWGTLEIFETTAGRIANADVVESFVAAAMAEVDAEGFLAAARQASLPACRLHQPVDVLAWDHLAARGSLCDVDTGAATLRTPGPPSRFDGAGLTVGAGVDGPPTARRVLSRPGADTAEVLASWTARTQPDAAAEAATSAPPLAGIRVVDLTWVWAGPFAAMQLAHLGADVVKIESLERIDVTRRLGPFVDEVPGVDRSGYFNQYNQGKRSVVLDPRPAAGRELLARLLASADVVIDNMRAGALDRMGFDDAALRRLNPDIVAVSMTGFGESGPERDRVAYGSLIDALAGVTATTGPVDGPATEVPMSLPDPASGLQAAIATLAGLYRARRGGGGADVEVSMLESWLAANPWGLWWQQATGAAPVRRGTRDDLCCPHGAFRCAGDYAWVAIAVADDDQFSGLAHAIGRPGLAVDVRFATVADRRCHEGELEDIVSAWTATRDPATAAAVLGAHGVAARPARTMDEVLACPHLADRDFFVRAIHPEAGDRPLCGPPWRAGRSAMRAGRAAPTLGQHTAEVGAEVWRLEGPELDRLRAEGVLG